jgi:outer membrane protein insertion porin family/translocation and assembly module TamA
LAASQIGRSCDPTDTANYDPNRCAVPLGGDTLWELSAELRVPIDDPFGAVVFCDSSDVAPNVAQFRFNHLHLSCGLGLRYDTPVGPVRADVGYRIPGAQVIGETVDPKIEGDPGTVFGAPIAIALGIGEAF